MRQDDEQPTGLVEVWSLRGVDSDGSDPEQRDLERVYDYVRMHVLLAEGPISLRAIEHGLEMAPEVIVRYLLALVTDGRVAFVAAGQRRPRIKAATHENRV